MIGRIIMTMMRQRATIMIIISITRVGGAHDLLPEHSGSFWAHRGRSDHHCDKRSTHTFTLVQRASPVMSVRDGVATLSTPVGNITSLPLCKSSQNAPYNTTERRKTSLVHIFTSKRASLSRFARKADCSKMLFWVEENISLERESTSPPIRKKKKKTPTCYLVRIKKPQSTCKWNRTILTHLGVHDTALFIQHIRGNCYKTFHCCLQRQR